MAAALLGGVWPSFAQAQKESWFYFFPVISCFPSSDRAGIEASRPSSPLQGWMKRTSSKTCWLASTAQLSSSWLRSLSVVFRWQPGEKEWLQLPILSVTFSAEMIWVGQDRSAESSKCWSGLS